MSLSFERTDNLETVHAILTHPDIWPFIGDDLAPDVHAWRPNADTRIWYVLGRHKIKVFGLWMFCPQSEVCWDAHVAMLPWASAWVKHTGGVNIVPWIWKNTTCRRIVASVPRSNPRAIVYGMWSMGMQKYGVNEKSFLKGGVMLDQVLMGVSRPEAAACPA